MDFQIVRADVSDAEAIAAVIQTCYEQMEHKEWYFPDNAEYMRWLLSSADESDLCRKKPDIKNLIENEKKDEESDAEAVFWGTGRDGFGWNSIRGLAYKALEAKSGTLAGIFTVAFPGDSPKSLGWDIGFDAARCRQTAHMDTAAVLPKYRGHQLQYHLMQTAEQELRRMGFRYLAATVYPKNHASKNTMLRQGYQVMITKEKYGGHLRDVMLKVLDIRSGRNG
ncbi:MAG: GNAT family N-acetyltransferase [Lachnospiraceae bacterium]|nr:GNAT family N-acetyltransferase [Lachnospiraceae bacterium]